MSFNVDNIEFEILSPQRHVGDFTCGKGINENSISQYLLSEEALNDQLKGIATTTLIIYEDVLIGFYTICCMYLQVDNLDAVEREDLQKPHCTVVPALEIKFLATHTNFQSLGVGTAILDVIIADTIELTKWAGCRYLYVSSSPNAVKFYRDNKFVEIEIDYFNNELIPMRLLIPSYYYLMENGISIK